MQNLLIIYRCRMCGKEVRKLYDLRGQVEIYKYHDCQNGCAIKDYGLGFFGLRIKKVGILENVGMEKC